MRRVLADMRPIPRRCLSRDESAIYVSVGTTKFDELVVDSRMPKPFRIDGRLIWDICDLDAAIENLKGPGAEDPWDRMR
jgi:hypothetical protein